MLCSAAQGRFGEEKDFICDMNRLAYSGVVPQRQAVGGDGQVGKTACGR